MTHPQLRAGGAEPGRGWGWRAMTQWARWPNRIGAVALVVLAVILCYAGLSVLAGIVRQCCTSSSALLYGLGMLGIASVVMSLVVLGLAVVAIRAPDWWAVGGIAAGAAIPLTMSAAVEGAQGLLLLVAILAVCALGASAVQVQSAVRPRPDRT
jgi:hypothetical protein